MSEFLVVGLGGALGTMARYGVWRSLPPQAGAFTWTIFAVNVVLSIGVGLLVATIGLLIGESLNPTP